MRILRNALRGIFKEVIMIAALFILALLVNQITAREHLDAYLRQHPQPWTDLTLGLAGAGLVLLLFAWVSYGVLTGRRMSDREARVYMSRSAAGPTVHRVSSGTVVDMTTPEGVATLHAVKEAFSTGAWLRDPTMRVYCVGMVGLLLFTLGGFGFFVVVGPPSVKVIFVGALLYAFGRTAWALKG